MRTRRCCAGHGAQRAGGSAVLSPGAREKRARTEISPAASPPRPAGQAGHVCGQIAAARSPTSWRGGNIDADPCCHSEEDSQCRTFANSRPPVSSKMAGIGSSAVHPPRKPEEFFERTWTKEAGKPMAKLNPDRRAAGGGREPRAEPAGVRRGGQRQDEGARRAAVPIRDGGPLPYR